MRDEQIKELISAYLDGEVSVEERALVERYLADSTECQQFLDHLRRQRVALQSLPRRRLQVDLSQRVLQAIEQARPAATSLPLPAAKRTWWRTRQGLSVASGTAAALVLLAVYLTSVDQGSKLAGKKEPVVPTVPLVTDGPKVPGQSPEDLGPQKELPPETLVAVREFQQLVQYILIYDISVTPQAQKNKVFEGWMAKAGIPIGNGIVLDQRLSKEILASRFVADAKIAAGAPPDKSKQDVRMLFVRGTVEQIDAVYREYQAIRNQPNPEIRIGMDLAASPRELNIFLQLNKATGLDLAAMKANPRSLRAAGAFPIQFQSPLNGTSTSRSATLRDAADQVADAGGLFGAASLGGVAQPAGNPSSADANSSSQPGQALFIIRNQPEESN